MKLLCRALFFIERQWDNEVAIIMGSNSDWPVLEPAEKTLKSFGVEVEVVVASAHRTPEMVHEFAAGARERGVEVIIAAAGAAAHLGGCYCSIYNTAGNWHTH